ncbi:SigE family RNA polymerase sigma factor [Actinoplanes friuliensis]|uniref:ECF subfamily RNA polymerase sigma-24 subunit n=1 Tax=Actinoplanes friuliensis DSM 7358 TaxID=1246995 RepID=U5VSN4_9ACTN|nr:ECF subfamily RNA polymerase sigma-24 subunit [Actinoplanes friuliensis DSM 7358]
MNADAEDDFLTFVRLSTPSLMRVAFALTGQQQAAEDLVQTALERVATRWTRLTEPYAYARRIMYHEHISWWRRWRRQEVPVPQPEDRAAPGDLAGDVALRDDLRTALDQLGPRQRAVLVLRYLEDRSVDEVAEVLGCSAGTVRSQTSRALLRLREFTTEQVELATEGGTR